ncbi:hypothetical protein WDU94_013166 [Cyamophila willieti]
MSSAIVSPVLQLVLYASNQKGRSDVLLLEDIALRDPEKRTEWVTGGGAGSSSSPLIMTACILIITISIVLLGCFLLVVRKRGTPTTLLTDDGEVIKQQLTSHQNGGRGVLDERYIVSYQLKSTAGGGDKQPDILSRGE